MSAANRPLHQRSFSLDHEALIQLFVQQENILIVQDLDGVCMGLVKDPLTRSIEPQYLQATRSFDGHFYVLTNGEHIGKRGVNRIVERAFGSVEKVKQEKLYLPGLAGGGVQWQNRDGNVSHPGVSAEELAFLAEVPREIESHLQQFLPQKEYGFDNSQIEKWIHASVLDNKVSPTANLNLLHEVLQGREDIYLKLQVEMQQLMERLLQKAEQKGLGDAFFVHYAPNLGKDSQGKEIIQLAKGLDSGTTDLQFMLRGAVKEVGVLVILNRYYYQKTGNYPLGANFNVRQAPREQQKLLDLIGANFDPAYMPTIVGIGDTVTSKAEENGSQLQFRRGGSDRGFLELIQAIEREFNRGNIVVYVDSSRGEVKNRKSLKLESLSSNDRSSARDEFRVVEGPGDPRDKEDPLTLNVVFPHGHQQYIQFFQEAARQRQQAI